MKKYSKPQFEAHEFDAENIMTKSGLDQKTNGQTGGEIEWNTNPTDSNLDSMMQ